MGKSTISMVIFHSYVTNYQRVFPWFQLSIVFCKPVLKILENMSLICKDFTVGHFDHGDINLKLLSSGKPLQKKRNWKDPQSLIGKSTISMGRFQ